MNHAEIYIGADIGGTKCSVSLGDASGRVVETRAFPTEHGEGGWKRTTDRLREAAAALAERAPGTRLRAVGISCGSPMDRARGVIQEPANLPGWKEVPICGIFRESFPGANVYLENDANAGALAEHAFGAGRAAGSKHMLFLTFGTGLGAGIIIDGRLYRGATDYAGEIGHFRLAPYGPAGCGKPGSFEGFCSGGGILQLALIERRAWFGPTCLPLAGFETQDVGEGAARGDALCRRILAVSGTWLGRGLALVLDLLNPDLIVIGSIFGRCERFLRPAMEAALAEEARPETLAACRVVPAALGEAIGAYAALAVAYHEEGLLESLRGERPQA